VRVEQVEAHRVEPETYTINEAAANTISRALLERRRVIAVGTTTTRALESAAISKQGRRESSGGDLSADAVPQAKALDAGTDITDLFIYPGFEFRVANGLVTNFHLPCSSLLMLVSAFAERELILGAYRHAVEKEYRFYSYGDAMLIV